MNSAELHLLVNHVPLFCLLIGVFILLAGIFLNRSILRNTAYVLFIIGSIGAIASVLTGEEAEELVEDAFPNISHEIIHEHEEVAELARTLCIVQGLLSIMALFFSLNKKRFEKLTYIVLVLLGIVSTVWLARSANTGGQIMHLELRDDFNLNHD